MSPKRLQLFCVLLYLSASCASSVMATAPRPLIIDQDITGDLLIPKTPEPHQITKSITIRPAATVRIERGAKVGVAGGASITLMSDLTVVGEGDEKVAFGPRDGRRAWHGFRIADQADITLSNLLIVGADAGLKTGKRTKLSLKDVVVRRCETGIGLFNGRHSLEHCLVTDCIGSGVHGDYSFVTIERCTVSKCREFGIELTGKVSLVVDRSVIADNDINLSTPLSQGAEVSKLSRTSLLRPGTLNIKHRNKQSLEARGCYWGTDSAELISRSIEDGRDLPNRGRVDFAEFLPNAPSN